MSGQPETKSTQPSDSQLHLPARKIIKSFTVCDPDLDPFFCFLARRLQRLQLWLAEGSFLSCFILMSLKKIFFLNVTVNLLFLKEYVPLT